MRLVSPGRLVPGLRSAPWPLAVCLVLASAPAVGCTVRDPVTDAGGRLDAPADTGRPDAPATRCASDPECSDAVGCTIDTCVVGGVCEHQPIDGMCAADQRCDPATGCVARGECTTSPDCMAGRGFCDGTWACIGGACYQTAPPGCDDGNDCTVDSCDPAAMGGAGGCRYAPADGCDGGVVAGDGGAPVCDPFDPATGYTGAFRLAPSQVVDCVSGSYRLDTVTFAVVGGQLQVTGSPSFAAVLTGPVPSGSTFSVSGSAGCVSFTLSGTFACANRFSGTLVDTFGAGCGFCGGGSHALVGRR